MEYPPSSLLQKAFEHAEDALSVHRTDGTLLLVNDAFCRLVGKPREEILGRKCYEVVHNEEDFPHFCPMVRTKRDLLPHNAEFSMRGRDFMVSVYPVLDDGEIRAVVHIIKDITELKQKERQLEEARSFLQSVIDGIADPIVVVDLEYRIMLANRAFRRLYPGSGRCYRVTHNRSTPCRGADHPCPLEEVRRLRKPVVVEHVHRQGDETRYIEIIASPLFSPDGSLIGVVESMRDVTEHRRREEEVRRYARELEESNRMKELFLDILRHDVLNPAGVALNFTELLLEEAHTEEERENLEAVKRSILRLIQIVEDASTLARLESGAGVEFEELNLAEVINRAVAATHHLFRQRGMRIELNFSERLPMVGSRMLEQVFINLLSNAAKYASTGKRVVVEVEEEEDSYLVKVRDFGPGIPDEFKRAVFERFSRKEKRGVKGIGLGLAIVRRIVELHGGEVWVEDNSPQGAVFCVRLPKRRHTNLSKHRK
ncbi:MAG: PAS domain-containing protein [Euryarchaeota archaeon]|nr:PAS domain-containing protein [Euryarchaeota archaeon]